MGAFLPGCIRLKDVVGTVPPAACDSIPNFASFSFNFCTNGGSGSLIIPLVGYPTSFANVSGSVGPRVLFSP